MDFVCPNSTEILGISESWFPSHREDLMQRLSFWQNYKEILGNFVMSHFLVFQKHEWLQKYISPAEKTVFRVQTVPNDDQIVFVFENLSGVNYVNKYEILVNLE